MQQRIRQWQVVCHVSLALVFMLALAAPAGAIVKELSNDSFGVTGTISCVMGFAEGESAAVKLTAEPGDYPYEIRNVRMLICPASTAGSVALRIYEDNTGTVLPGPLLYEEIVQVTGSDFALNELDLSLLGIVISSGSVRVELEWLQQTPPGPGIARDTDGFIPNVNYVYSNSGGWFFANQVGVVGDFIIRMEIETDAETPIFADGFETGDTTEWSDTTP